METTFDWPIDWRIDWNIDEDIRRAETLPAEVYRDPRYFALARERVFARSWQWVADTDAVRVPGQVWPVTLLDGVLDEPLLLTRTAEDELRCVSNVCTHRGTLVCEAPGVLPALRCRYHGRRFALDGRFLSMPEFSGAEGFPSERDHLRQVPFATWGKMIFASLDPVIPFAELIAEMDARVGFLPLREAVLDPSRSRDYLVRANWALYCDNFLEGFHIPYVHAALADALDYGEYRTELFPWSNLQLGVASGADDVFDLPPGHPDAGLRVAAWYFWLFPNTMVNVYPWGISLNVVRPLAPDRTRVSFLSYVWDPERLDRGAGAGLDRVEREDEAVVESVQRGVRSRIYRRGRYSPAREAGVHHFHRLLQRFLAG
ncbi:MAG TPA: aromatic ring-hydroxylating dioxygenase subunit alpha [Thermoanaerobaculia bacterium]|nr:aromatic ring-hydroxylating dioxygenase subunit alpha [Thermoanaerobaculia bacterium]